MTPLILGIFFILGSILASFFHLVILRMHGKKAGIVCGRSECPKCGHQLHWYDLIPLLSFVLLAGKCRYCHKKISYNYFLIELITGILFALIAYHLLPHLLLDGSQFTLMMAVYLFYASVLIFITFYDLYYYIIPDQVSLPAIAIAIVLCFLPFTPGFLDALFGALIPFTFFALQILISKGKWIGGGDLRIALFMGIILGPAKVIAALFLAYLSGSIIGIGLIVTKKKKMQSKIPFGPFLCFGTYICLLWGQEIIDWYIRGLLL